MLAPVLVPVTPALSAPLISGSVLASKTSKKLNFFNKKLIKFAKNLFLIKNHKKFYFPTD